MKNALVLLFLGLLGTTRVEAATCLVDAGGSDANSCCTTAMPCLTIRGAVLQATAGDVVSVAAGTYPEPAAGPLVIDKSLTLEGAQSGIDARGRVGAESIISDTQGTSVSASNVVIDGFTIQGSTNAAFTGYGVWLNPGVSGTQVLNNIIQDNIVGLGIANAGPSQLLVRHNVFKTNNQTGSASGSAIYTDQYVGGPLVNNVLVDANDFTGNANAGLDLSNTCADAMAPVAPCVALGNGVSNLTVENNAFDMNGRAFVVFNTHTFLFTDNSVKNSTLAGSAALRIFDFNSDVTIENNDLSGGVGYGIRLSDLAVVGGPSSNVRIHFNNITPFALDGLLVDAASHVGTVDAECNWWGSDTGPANTGNPGGTGEAVVGDADFDPWFVGPAPDGPCGTLTPTATPTSTPTPTETHTQVPTRTPTGSSGIGEQCADPSECQGFLFCVDGVCCNTPCDGPADSCVIPNQVGICGRPRTAPATSAPSQAVVIGLCLIIGWLGLRALRRTT